MLVDLHCGPELQACTIYIAGRSYRLVRFYIADSSDCMIYVHELRIKLLKSNFESCPVSSCGRY